MSQLGLACHIYFSVGRCLLELAQGPSRVALAWHEAGGSTPLGVTILVASDDMNGARAPMPAIHRRFLASADKEKCVVCAEEAYEASRSWLRRGQRAGDGSDQEIFCARQLARSRRPGWREPQAGAILGYPGRCEQLAQHLLGPGKVLAKISRKPSQASTFRLCFSCEGVRCVWGRMVFPWALHPKRSLPRINGYRGCPPPPAPPSLSP